MLINQILTEAELNPNAIDWEIEMSKIPDQYEFRIGNVTVRWYANQNNWGVKNSSNGSFVMLEPEVATDLKGNPLRDANGNFIKTKYHKTWRQWTKGAMGKLDDLNKDGDSSGSGNPADPEPLKDKTTVELVKGDPDKKFVYDLNKNQWYNTKTRKEVDPNSEAHKILMGKMGFKPDGKTKLSPKDTSTLMTNILTRLGLPDLQNLGLASQVKARNAGGRVAGKLGDWLGKKIGPSMANAFMGLAPFSSTKDIDQLIKQLQGPEEDNQEKDYDDIFGVEPTDNQTELDKQFDNSKNKNPDIELGSVVTHKSYPNKKFKWEKRENGQLNWRDESGRIHTVLPNVHKSIIDNLTSEDLEQLNKGENISINNKPLTSGQLFHARLYAVYHQKNK